MKLENPKTPKFYASPKIYEQANPGRPIFYLSQFSHKFVDHYLRPHIQNISWYVKDTYVQQHQLTPNIAQKGTICAQSYMNIFRRNFESADIYSYIRDKAIAYL